jgi:fructose-1,6-bisphosphatase-3
MERAALEALAEKFPTIGRAQAEIAALQASLLLPRPVVHVLSDVHGEYGKLRHVLNNVSGRLRPLVQQIFADRLTQAEINDLLSLLYYPQEAMDYFGIAKLTSEARAAWALTTLRRQFEIVRALTVPYRHRYVDRTFPPDQEELFQELLAEPITGRPPNFLPTLVTSLAEHETARETIRAACHVVRNLAAAEIIVAGDMGDRGPRIDGVLDYLQRQPDVAFTWGNHDASWMGACLGSEACIATVLRFSVRYDRLDQLEEGYGIPLAPLEKLAREVYGDDPAEHFAVKVAGVRDPLHLARMQKAAAMLEFKCVGQAIQRHPEWRLDHRVLLKFVDKATETVTIDGVVYPLEDTHLPTLDQAKPCVLSPEEQECMTQMRNAFVNSPRLWEQMTFLVRQGAMVLRRDDCLIFHACVPTDSNGAFLTLPFEGVERSGRVLFNAITLFIRRAFRRGASHVGAEGDWFWYLWAGPRSPLFGKDRIATFESYFVADKKTHEETKNPYFEQIHDAAFCRRILREFGAGQEGMIVNGHVPVKMAEGEQPVKRGGNAVTIDGAFSEAYGDRGYTLLLTPEGLTLAEHAHFDSIEQVLTDGDDMLPKTREIRTYPRPRLLADTEDGIAVRETVGLLETLILAYQEGEIRQNALL